MAEMPVPYVTLYPTGQKLPQVGMGTWKLDNSLCEETIYQAIKLGYRHFDAACDYGNEVEVGLGVKKAIQEGIVRREDLFITSKVCTSTFARYPFSHASTALEYVPCKRARQAYCRKATQGLWPRLF